MEGETKKKLPVLVTHWMEHNREHASEYETWAGRAKQEGLAEVAHALQEAADIIQKTNEKLLKAWESLKKMTKE